MSRLLVAAFFFLVAVPAGTASTAGHHSRAAELSAAAALPPLAAALPPAATALRPVARQATAAPRPATVCTIRDARLSEISGMAATRNGYVVIDDSSDDASRRKMFFLNKGCKVTRTLSYPSRPRDTEDLASAADGTLWVGDIGDNNLSRTTVGVWKLAPGAKTPVLYRLRYPDGPHDAEALLLGGDGTPIIVTKDPGTADIYIPATPLRAGATVALKRVGQFTIPNTKTSNPYSLFGRVLITGAATSPDGGRVVLRTYADAFEFDVPGGNVVAALTTAKPRVVALPDEPQGESIAYGTDGTTLLTVSESSGQPAGTRPSILRYGLPAASTARAAQPTPTRTSASTDPPTAITPVLPRSGAGWTYPALAIASVGMLLAVTGLFGFYRSRRDNR